MRHQKVKILAFFLAVFIAVASFPALKSNAATIASGTCGTNISWTLDDSGLLTIQGSGAMPDYESINDAPWYSYRKKVKSISFSSSITHISQNAFANCAYLTSVTIPNSVLSIGESAFLSCSRLTSVTLSNKLTSIENYTFSECTTLTSIAIPSSVDKIKTKAFWGDKTLLLLLSQMD